MQALERVPWGQFKVRHVYDRGAMFDIPALRKYLDKTICEVCGNEIGTMHFVSVQNVETGKDTDLDIGDKCAADLKRATGQLPRAKK